MATDSGVEVVDGWEPGSVAPRSTSRSHDTTTVEAERLERPLERVERLEQHPSPKTFLGNPERVERLERFRAFRAMGYGKERIIFELWGVRKGGSQKYKDAESMYEQMLKESGVDDI